jgi:cytochrome b pre-mRNA-processing protein 3
MAEHRDGQPRPVAIALGTAHLCGRIKPRRAYCQRSAAAEQAMIALFRRNPTHDAAERAYAAVVAQARQPAFFLRRGVPDTIDGRFELICLHAFLYLRRLKAERPRSAALAQRFFDHMFGDLDRSLREMGTGDLSVGREVKQMAKAFYGRIQAYERGLDRGGEVLEAALTRNLYGTVAAVPAHLVALGAYLRREDAALAVQPAVDLLAGRVEFGAPP